jgi:hypothetical protein
MKQQNQSTQATETATSSFEDKIFFMGNESINVIQALIPLLKQREQAAKFFRDEQLSVYKVQLQSVIEDLNEEIKKLLSL